MSPPTAPCFTAAPGGGWELSPSWSLDAIRTLAAIGASLGEDLVTATVGADHVAALLERFNHPHAARRPARACRRRGTPDRGAAHRVRPGRRRRHARDPARALGPSRRGPRHPHVRAWRAGRAVTA